jgi:hypothetical protein
MSKANQNLQLRGGKNNPLMPNVDHYTVAKDADLLINIPRTPIDVDTLIVPPPDAGGSREILMPLGATGPGILLFLQGATLAIRTILLYKDSRGNLTFLNDATWGPGTGNEILYWGPIGNAFLFPEDRGLFVRVANSPNDGKLSVLPTWRDVRNVHHQDTVLTTSYQKIHPDIPAGSAISGTIAPDGGSLSKIFNYSIDPALVSLRWTFPGGKVIEQLPPRTVGAMSNSFFNEVQTVPAGAFVEAKLAAPIATPGAILRLIYGLTNDGPMSQNAGGVAF